MEFLLVPLGGLLNRWRGASVWPLNHTVKRITLAIATGILTGVSFNQDWKFMAAASLAVFLGFLPGWADKWHSVLKMGGRGTFLVAPLAAVLNLWGFDPASLFLLGLGFMMGPIYWLGWRLPTVHPRLNKGPEWGELLFGMWLWLSIIGVSYV